VAGNFFVIKAVGAASEQGADLDELLRIGEKVNDVTRTMGMALTACTPPAKGSPLFELGGDEMEMGVGIHGEPGRRREKLARRRDRRRHARGGGRRPAVRARATTSR
jgi:dihydroxyacetone kinase-like protein